MSRCTPEKTSCSRRSSSVSNPSPPPSTPSPRKTSPSSRSAPKSNSASSACSPTSTSATSPTPPAHAQTKIQARDQGLRSTPSPSSPPASPQASSKRRTTSPATAMASKDMPNATELPTALASASTFFGAALLPSLLHQDPRYFYRGKGRIVTRALYAISTVVICKGDNGHWQPNYSNVLGNLAAGGLSSLYYPDSDRHDAQVTVDNILIGVGTGAIGTLFQEFLLKHLTHGVPPRPPTTSP